MKKLLNFGIIMVVAYFFISSVQSIYAGTCRRCSNSYGCQIAKFETSSPINADGGCDASANPIGTVERFPAMASYSNSGGSCVAKGDGSQGAGSSPYFNNMCYEAPIGYIDSITCDGIKGWTCDPNEANTPGGDVQIPIHIYNGSNYVTWDVAYRDRPDVPNAGFCGKWTNAMNGAHGFDLQLPASLRDNQPHTIYVYGINQGPGGNTNLPSAATGSPGITIQCAPQTYTCPSRCSTRYGCTQTGTYTAYDGPADPNNAYARCNNPVPGANNPPYSPADQDTCKVSTDPTGNNNNCIAPSAPANMTGSCVANGAGGYNAVFTWNQVTTPVAGVTYKISVNGGTQIATATTNSYTLPGAVLGQTYTWNVLPTAKSGFPAASATAGPSFTCLGNPPAAPTGFVGACTNTTLTFTWNMVAGNTYKLIQGTNTISGASSPYTTTGARGTVYSAQLYAINAQNQQSLLPASVTGVSCAPLITQFTTLASSVPPGSTHTLTWNAPTATDIAPDKACNIPEFCGNSSTNFCLSKTGSKDTPQLTFLKTYTLTCRNASGTDSAQVTANIDGFITTPPASFSQTPGLVFSGASIPTSGDGLLSIRSWLVGPTANGNPKFTPDHIDQPLTLSYEALAKTVKSAGQLTPSLPANCSTNCPKGVYDVTDPNNPAATVTLGNITVTGDKTQPVIILARGNVKLTGPIKITNSEGFFLLASGGDIIVDAGVGSGAACASGGTYIPGELQGIFSSHGSFITESLGTGGVNVCESGTTDKMLHIDGTIITNATLTGSGTLENNRDLCADNFNFPVLRIIQRPQLILSAPEFIKPQKTTFQELAP